MLVKDLRGKGNAVMVVVNTPPGIEVGLRGESDDIVTYVSKNVWTVKSTRNNDILLDLIIYPLPLASGQGSMFVNIEAI